MSGTLYVVATPIGNLEDITLRALRILREVDVIAAEDTRRTARLLGHHGISTRMLSFHEHNTRSRLPQLVSKLVAGENVAIVTDAGTPGVSDPGLELVQAAIERGISVDPIPGAAAPLAALIASGFTLIPFSVFGFPPSGVKARKEWFGDVALISHTFSFFEAPHRIIDTLRAAATILVDRPICVARELTKVHQEFIRGTAGHVADVLNEPRGEFTIVVGPADNSLLDSDILLTDAEIVQRFWQSTESGGATRRQIVTMLARQSGRTAKDVYAVIEQAKKSGVQP